MIPSTADTITFSCTSCGVRLTVPTSLAGIIGPCPHCRAQITSPASSAPPESVLQPIPSFPQQSESAAPVAPSGVSSVPLWQQLPQSTGQPSPVSVDDVVAPEVITPKGGLPGNFTRSIPSVEPEPVSNRRQRTNSPGRDGRRWGALIGALFFIGLALAGAGWFFKDQVRIFWDRTVAHFQKGDAPDASGIDPDVAVLLKKNVKPATGPGGDAGKKVVTASKPKDSKVVAATNKVAGEDSKTPKEPVKAAPQTRPTAQVETPAVSPPARKTQIETTPAVPGGVLAVTPPQSSLPAETTRKAESPVSTTAENPDKPAAKTATAPPDAQVRRALPVDSGGPLMKPGKEGLPEILSPTPPAPPAPATAGLVEVPSSAKGSPALAAPGEERPVFIKASADARPAADTLRKFFLAKTWQERLSLTQPQEKVRPLMERYYADNPDGPMRVSSIELIRHEKTPEIGTPLCVFQVSGPDLPEPLPVMVESSPDGWKVDWLTLMEFKDKLLLRYLQKWQDEPGRFHVMVRRTHYFDEDVPGLDKKHCFELMPPSPGYSGFAFVTKGTPLAQNLDHTIGWEVANIAAIVELHWCKQDRYQWVEITAVPQFNWRSTLPTIPVAQPAGPMPEPGSETMLAKPASSVKPPAVAEKK